MRLAAQALIKLSFLIVPVFTLPVRPAVSSRLNITTIGAANSKSTLECWQLSAPLVQSSQAGTSGAVIAQLGETGAARNKVRSAIARFWGADTLFCVAKPQNHKKKLARFFLHCDFWLPVVLLTHILHASCTELSALY